MQRLIFSHVLQNKDWREISSQIFTQRIYLRYLKRIHIIETIAGTVFFRALKSPLKVLF